MRAVATTGDQTSMYGLIPLSALPDASYRPEDLLWGEILFRGATTVLAGQPGAGKTTLARGITYAVATGREYCGFHGPPGGVPALYLDYETAGAYRVSRWKRVFGDDLASVANVYVNDAYAAFHPKTVCAEARRLGLGLVVVDTLARAFDTQDENSNSEMTRIMAALDFVAREAHCAVLAVTHQAKGRSSGVRGASAIGASAAVVATFGRATTDDGSDSSSAVYVLDIEKNRLGGDGAIRVVRDGDGGFALAPDSDGSAEASRAERMILEVIADADAAVRAGDLIARSASRYSGGGKVPSTRTFERALVSLFERGILRRPERGLYELRAQVEVE